MTRVYADSWLEVEKGLGGIRPVLAGSVEEMREQFNASSNELALQYPPVSTAVTARDGSIGNVQYRVYTPAARSSDKKLPIGVYYHPGGLVLGPSQSDEVLCRSIAQKTSSIVIGVRYRLSPEHKAPCHLEDALVAFEWAYLNGTQLRGDTTRMYVIGASAGGGLALAVTRKVVLGLSRAAAHAVKGVIALCPNTVHPLGIPIAYATTHLSYDDNKDNVPLINKASMLQFFNAAGLQPDDQGYFVALDREHHSLFPPTYLVTCEFDPSRDDGKCLSESFRTAGVPVKADHYGDLPHCFWMYPSLPETETFTRNLVDGVKWVLSQT